MARAWSRNDLACVNTWAFLRGLGQFNAKFDDAKKIRMSELKFRNPVATSDANQIAAKQLTAQLDRIYIKALMAKYEEGFNFAAAVPALTEAVMTDANTLVQLADVVDSIYNFRGEVK